MKSIVLYLVLLSSSFLSLAQQKYLFMRDAIYQDSNYCAFLLKPSNNLLIGQIINVSDINQKVADSLGLESFVFPVGLDSNKIVGFKVENLPLAFDDNETIERWGTSKNKLIIKPSALNRIPRRQVNSSIISVDVNGKVTRDFQPFYDNQINRSQRGYTRAVNFDKTHGQYYFATVGSNLIVFNPSLSKVIAFDYDGNLLSKSKINIEKPSVYSNKGKYLVNDVATNNLYIIVQTNFSYNIYLINLEDGRTTFLESLAGVWENPSWKAKNGVLSYQREGDNFELDLHKKGAQ